jgi:hypothetical protein
VDFGDGTTSTELNPVHTLLSIQYVVTQTVTPSLVVFMLKKITFTVGKGYLLVVLNALIPHQMITSMTLSASVTRLLKNVRLDIYDTW